MNSELVDRIDDLLPQTQCRQCGYAGCRPYAEAIAGGCADINRCPPGGDAGIHDLATATGIACKPLDPGCGIFKPRAVAIIDEHRCIGCTLCIQACPVDAIAGAAKFMHTVIAAECTGCELCIPPCPVDCITMEPVAPFADEATRRAFAFHARDRHRAHLGRLAAETQSRRDAQWRPDTQSRSAAERQKRAAIGRAMERARQRLQKPAD